jgi:RNA-directed DNA polymerase
VPTFGTPPQRFQELSVALPPQLVKSGYGRYTRTAPGPILRYVNMTVKAWLMRKFKRYRGHKTKTGIFLKRLSRESSGLFAHWKIGMYGSFA